MLIPVILSGGSGTRLWPVSREAFPKPFMKLGGDQSLLQRTLLRAASCANSADICVVTNREYYFKTKEEVEAVIPLGKKTSYVLEPVGRNTAPAIALAALWARERTGDDKACLMILAADHLIADTKGFQAACKQAEALAEAGQIVLFGIRPNNPETGFGYIEMGAPINSENGESYQVARFVEKPDLNRALEYLQSGKFLWNSGMFCFRIDVILEAFRQHAPEVLNAAEAVWNSAQEANKEHKDRRFEFSAESFETLPNISIDYAVAEKAKAITVIPAPFDWSDIGSWTAVSEMYKPDAHGNTSVGSAVVIDSKNTHVHSQDRLIATVGVENLLVVETPDAVLVTTKDRSQDVKAIVAHLKASGHDAAKLHTTVQRPWGTYTVLQEGPRFKIKRIEVKPGASLSLQMHHHRSEHWIVVTGTAKVTNGDREFFVATNESTYIPVGTTHRLENPGVLPLAIIEVQCGDYLGEDDIVRFNDVYGRVPK